MIPDQPSDPPQHSLQIRGHTATYTDAGSGPTVVAVHGLPGGDFDFRWLGAALEPHCRFIRLNLPGFGGSAPGGCTFRWPAPAEWVAEAMDQLEVKDVTLLGHSYGSSVATAASLLRPERVHRLALLAPIGLRKHKGFRNFPIPKIAVTLLSTPGIRQPVYTLFRQAFRRAGFRKPISNEQIFRTIEAIASWSFEDYKARVQTLQIPVFGALSEDDHLVEAQIIRELLQQCPHGPRLAFEDGGHNLQKSYAVEVAAELLQWISTNPCTSGEN